MKTLMIIIYALSASGIAIHSQIVSIDECRNAQKNKFESIYIRIDCVPLENAK